MPNLSEISNGTKLLLGAGILLLIDSFLAWQRVSAEFGGVEIASASRSGWSGIGVVMGLALIALLAWVVIQVLNVKLNFDLPITEAWLTLGLGIAVFALALIKLITILGEASTIWSYIGVALAALVALGAWMRAQEMGGIGQRAMATGDTMSTGGDETMSPRDAGMGTGMGTGMGMGTAPTTGATPSTAPVEPAPPAMPAEPAEPATSTTPMSPTSPTMPADAMPETPEDDDTPRDTRPTV